MLWRMWITCTRKTLLINSSLLHCQFKNLYRVFCFAIGINSRMDEIEWYKSSQISKYSIAETYIARHITKRFSHFSVFHSLHNKIVIKRVQNLYMSYQIKQSKITSLTKHTLYTLYILKVLFSLVLIKDD